MPNPWDADVVIDETLVRDLITTQFPQLVTQSITLIGQGWDNAAYLIDKTWVFRFPRRKIAAPLMVTETDVLRLFGDKLALAIPYPKFFGAPQPPIFPYSFTGYALIPGQNACLMDWSLDQRAANAGRLGQFLYTLHSLPINDQIQKWVPKDHIRRSDLPYRFDKTVEMAKNLADVLCDFDTEAVLNKMKGFVNTPPPKDLFWVHGDLYPCHLLADEKHEICGVIDWGDVHLGDPAIDVSIAFSFLPPNSWPDFRKTYEEGIDNPTWDRARFRALHYAFTFLWYGREEQDKAASDLGWFILDNAMKS